MTDIARMTNLIQEQEETILSLTKALDKSLELQSHYANLLNMYDGGFRMTFQTINQWLERLEKIK